MTKKKRKKHYGLCVHTTKKQAKEFVDFDYVSELTPEEADWLNQFAKEYYQADMRGATIHPDSKRKELYNDNNRRYRDAYTQWEKVDLDTAFAPDKKDEDDV
jgi:hypothetical protein